MLTQFSYPIVCSEKFEQTVAFYEDHFDFVPAFEMSGFVILKREGWDSMYLAVMDSQHEGLPDAYRRPAQGIILNYPVESVVKFYDYAYHEGLSLKSEPADAACGRNHFFVEDPNGILIDVAENIDMTGFITPDNEDEFVVMQSAS